MEIIGFYYDNAERRIEAFGKPIPGQLVRQGYSTRYHSDGRPAFYVKPISVFIVVDINGKKQKFDIYHNIMAIYPDRKQMSLRLAQSVFADLLQGNIHLEFRNGSPYLRFAKNFKKK